MSSSSLWTIDNNFNGNEYEDFSNSWLVSPMVWDVLFEKYLPHKVQGPFGRQRYMTAINFDPSIFEELNKLACNSDIKEDKILWILTNEQVFHSKDKQLVSSCLKNFLNVNFELTSDFGDHIHDRFNEVAESILSIDENDHPYFVFKGTSVDDNVERWFETYDEESDEYINASFDKFNEIVTGFVFIENDSEIRFLNNLDYFKQKKEEA
ncbi:hypothetical protein [Virgibacillus salexigens]|uniref:Uncharacterized protein n=1 Tax=Virgibacillus massiliensis TaxID=1462526 RepID=A0A024QH98_9BACI|nr:hypothetical protein [Virgibacillus massiliensis]CDQ41923.1 hypothetical protein BN990_04302 [Virgibacillus massiliensis]